MLFQQIANDRKNFVISGGHAICDIEYFASPVLKRRYVRSDDIFNVHIIAVFGSVPIYYRLHPGEHLLRKDSENAGLSFRTLTRPINITITQNNVFQTVEKLEREQVVLDCVFADPIRRYGVDGMVLGYGECSRLAIRCACRGDVDNSFRFVLDSQFQEIDRFQDIERSSKTGSRTPRLTSI